MIKSYIDTPATDISLIGSGHINETYLVTAGGQYILQKMNASLYGRQRSVLRHNYLEYRRAVTRAGEDWLAPEWLTDRKGHFFHVDENGDLWRMYEYIPSDRPLESKSSDMNIYEIGRGLGTLHRILRGCDDIRVVETTAHLHDLRYHYDRYLEASETDVARDAELDELIDLNIEYLLSLSVPRSYIIHGDAKVSNMIISDGKVRGFIDLDTIMPGSIFDDLADCARSCCLDREGHFDADKVVHLHRGYEEGYDAIFTPDAIDLLGRCLVRNRFMLGIRYYTDYLTGGNYFGRDRSGQNLERAREQLKML